MQRSTSIQCKAVSSEECKNKTRHDQKKTAWKECTWTKYNWAPLQQTNTTDTCRAKVRDQSHIDIPVLMYWFCISKAAWNACSLFVIAFLEVSGCSIVTSDQNVTNSLFVSILVRNLHWILPLFCFCCLHELFFSVYCWCELKNSHCNIGWFWWWIKSQLIFWF